MSTAPNKFTSPILKEFDVLLDGMIGLQKKEQALILARQEKLAQIRRLAQQNHTLLEHSLFFLQQLFQKVLERDTPLHLYNLNGHAFQSDLGGGLLQTRI